MTVINTRNAETINIEQNGTYDVARYTTANVNMPAAPEIYRVFRIDNGKITSSITTPFLPLPSSATDIGEYCYTTAYVNTPPSVLSGPIDLSSLTTVSGLYACHYMFKSCTGITSVDLSSLTTISGMNGCGYMFQFCTGLTSFDLSSLTTLSGAGGGCQNMFSGCTGITSVDLSSLTTLSSTNACNAMFLECTGITSVDLSSLATISGGSACQNMFKNCTGITSIDFCSLATLSGMNCLSNMFYGCTNLSKVSFYALDTNSFGAYTNQFTNMLSGITGCTVHFPMRIQSTIGTWTTVTGGFNGTNTTVLFDIVCTLTGADTNTYIRSQKNSTSTATAWDNGGTLYYTSGTTEPAVSDTIYSDAECTVAVTTISSIS